MGENLKKLTIVEFKEKILEQLSGLPDCEAGILTQKVTKNNGVVLEGIFILNPDNAVSPAFYVESLYEEYVKGTSIDQIVGFMIRHFRRDNILQESAVEFYSDFECVKQRVLYRIINYSDNEKFLEDVPHRRFLDFAIIYYCKIEDNGNIKGNITILNSHLQMWKATEEELYMAAVSNTPGMLPEVLIDMEKMLEDIFERKCYVQEEIFDKCSVSGAEGEPDSVFSMYVLTNSENYYGAGVILYRDVLKRFASAVNKNFYILPSSIHEVILIFTDIKDDREIMRLQDMVFEVNNGHVDIEERLSYNVYYYNRFNDEIIIA